jgi:hypothetical protein
VVVPVDAGEQSVADDAAVSLTTSFCPTGSTFTESSTVDVVSQNWNGPLDGSRSTDSVRDATYLS